MMSQIRSLLNLTTKPIIQQQRNLSLLSSLKPAPNSQTNQKRLGRGPGSGLGKTSGRGQKGQKARGSVPNWFEGGQTPIYKLYPKRGFYRQQKLSLNELPLVRIQRYYDEGKLPLTRGETLTMAKMKKYGLISGTMKDGVSVLAEGAANVYNLNIKIEATKASQPAIEIIERNGGSFTSMYYSRYLGYRAHHSPEWFVKTRGYLPLQAKPIARRDILFYSNPDRRGYLTNSEYVKQIQLSGNAKSSNAVVKQTELEKELEKVKNLENSSKDFGVRGFTSNAIVSFKDLNL